MRGALYINGRDVGADFGFRTERIEGLTSFSLDVTRERLVGRAGTLRNVGNLSTNDKVLTIRGFFSGASRNDTRARMSEFFRWVRAGDLHTIETGMFPGKELYGVLTDVSDGFDRVAAAVISRHTGSGELSFLLHSPFMYDVNPSTYVGNLGVVVQPALGNAPSSPTVRLWKAGGVTNPSISLYRANGSLIKTVVFTITLGPNDFIEVNSDDMLIRKSLTNVVTLDANIAPFGDPFFILDPADGDPVNGLFPYFIGNNCTIEVTTRRIWTIGS